MAIAFLAALAVVCDLAHTNACIVTPCTEYVGARIRYAVKEGAGLDRAFTLRLTRNNDLKAPGRWGRVQGAMCQTLVETDKIPSRKVGTTKIDGVSLPVYETDVALDMGDIQDIVFKDRRGTYLAERMKSGAGRYLDLSVHGRMNTLCGPFADQRVEEVKGLKSAVRVLSVALEPTPAELETFTCVPGNVFAPEDRPETAVEVRVKKPGSYRLVWTIRDAEGRVLGRHERTFTKTGRVTVDLGGHGLGWYALQYEFFDGARRLMTHKASFAVLGPDTRTTGTGEGPYGAWDYGCGRHYTGPLEEVGPLLMKAGFRRAWADRKYPVAETRKYKLAPAVPVLWNQARKMPDDKLLAKLRAFTNDYPAVKGVMIYHESAPKGALAYQQAWELSGQAYDPANAWTNAAERVAQATHFAKLVRENFPDFRITVGNTLGCTELVAELIRYGFPESYADYTGLETIARNNLPERIWESSLQAADHMRQTVAAFGYRWKPNACFESNYRREALVGEERQLEWYVRDLVLSQCWRFPDIFVGTIADCGNKYGDTYWGTAGHCTRYPYHYPKKSYVGMAVATRMLDAVTDVRFVPTGDRTVYAVEFVRKDGSCVTALWTSRGTAEVTVEASAPFAAFDIYGRRLTQSGETPLPRESQFVIDGKVRYLVSDKSAVRSVRTGRRTYPDDVRPADAVVAETAGDASAWRLAAKEDPLLEQTTGPFMPYRTKGTFAVRQVRDEELGACLELELAEPNLSLPTVVSEYAVLELRKSVKLKGDPKSIGMMVKGNSGWGRIHWILRDAKGVRRISCGDNGSKRDMFDYDGRVSLSYSGWAFLSLPIAQGSSVPDLNTGSPKYLWAGSLEEPAYPLTLEGLAVSVESRPLFLTERHPHRQVIRLKDISVFDFNRDVR